MRVNTRAVARRALATASLAAGALLTGCTSSDVGKAVVRIAPEDQMLTTYGGNSDVDVPTTYRLGGQPLQPGPQTWYLSYLGSWSEAVPDPAGWSPFVEPGPTPQPGEVTKTIDGRKMVCGNAANDALHPMHDYYFTLSSNLLLIRNAVPTDFWCEKTYQDLWNYLDDVPGLQPGQAVLHTFCVTEFSGSLTRAGFRPKGPFACRFLFEHYRAGGQDRADIRVTLYSETDPAKINVDSAQLNIHMQGAAVEFP